MQLVNLKSLSMASIIALTLFACSKKDDPKPFDKPDENELITSLFLTFTPSDTSQTKTFIFRSAEGASASKPQRNDTILLDSGQVYSLKVEVKDESKNPVVDLTEEIKEKGKEHQFFYRTTPANLLSFDYSKADKDSLGKPIGLHFSEINANKKTTSAQLQVVLRHDLNKSGVGVSTGDITNASGSSDIEHTFPLKIK